MGSDEAFPDVVADLHDALSQLEDQRTNPLERVAERSCGGEDIEHAADHADEDEPDNPDLHTGFLSIEFYLLYKVFAQPLGQGWIILSDEV